MRKLAFGLALVAAGCTPVVVPAPQTASGNTTTTVQAAPVGPPVSEASAKANFAAVVRTVEPVAEQECRRRAPRLNCDFRIMVDDRPGVPANAFQTVDGAGRPILVFTVPLLREARNRDEVAFVMAHEAAHHIAGHLQRTRTTATLGALAGGALATALGGGDPAAIEAAQRIGATVGARSFSKEQELEADALGTIIAARAGYDPLKGGQLFFRIPDPGDRFLGSHPANADRLRTVQRVAAGL